MAYSFSFEGGFEAADPDATSSSYLSPDRFSIRVQGLGDPSILYGDA